jgi:hypothetical protein
MKKQLPRNCISEVPATNSYRRLPDFSERFIRRETTPEPPSIEAQGEVGFLHFRYVYYTIITILNNIPFMIQCGVARPVSRMSVTKLTLNSLSFSAVVRFPLYVFSITLGVLLYPTAL